MPSFVDTAHDYARRGWRVIPLHRVGGELLFCSCNRGGSCDSAGKHPKDNEWQKNPRMSGPDIQATWDDPKPPNIGIATGSESGFWVLDIDPDGGGMESMAQLVAEHGRLPDTYVVQTGSGGWHYYFAMPEFELRNTQSKLGRGIDTRATGGQVVAPPSVTKKGSYSVVQDVPLAQAPEWMLEALRKQDLPQVTAGELPRPEDIDPIEWERLNGYAERAITAELDRLVKLRETGWDGEPWNATTFEVSCALIEFGNSPWCAYSTGKARADVMALAPRDTDGFDDYTVAKTFDSALAKVGQGARPVPENRRPSTLAEDPLFGGAQVRHRDPSEGGGAQANPVVMTGPGRFFREGPRGAKEPLYQEMARGIIELGPVGFGIDRLWWSYNDGVWKPDEFLLHDRLSALLDDAWREGHAANTFTPLRTRSVHINGDPLEPLMNFRNGMLPWRDGDELIDHDPAYASTIQFPVDYDPAATCPTFDAWLESTLHPDYVELVWEMIGYLMMSGNPKHHAFLLHGIGGSGKSTLLRLIKKILGEENIAAETLEDLNGNRFRAASLFGKIANIAGDIDASYQENTAMFKRITGEDTITAEHKNKKPFRFINWAVPLFSANKIPGSADVTEGYLRRWLVLRFNNAIPVKERIDHLEERFVPELPGICAKAVRALRTMMARGVDGGFEPKGEAARGQEEFAEKIDQVRQWIASGQVSAAPGLATALPKLYTAYTIWAERSGKRKVSETEFSERLDSIGYKGHNTAGQIHHEGISVPDQPVTSPANFFGRPATNDEE